MKSSSASCWINKGSSVLVPQTRTWHNKTFVSDTDDLYVSFFVFQRRDGAEEVRRPSNPRDELLWSQQNVLPLVQTVCEHRPTQRLRREEVFLKFWPCCVSVQLAGGEGLVPAVHEARLGRHLLRDAGGQRVQHQDGLQRHGDQTWRPHRQPVQVSDARPSHRCYLQHTTFPLWRVCVCVCVSAGRWCWSAAATDTPAGGVRPSRASSRSTARPSSPTTASDPSPGRKWTSLPNGNHSNQPTPSTSSSCRCFQVLFIGSCEVTLW